MELLTPELAAALSTRPLRLSDAEAVHRVMAREELVNLGSVEMELADLLADWQRPSFDIGDSTVGVFAGEELVAYAEVSGAGRGDAAVDPAYQGRGIGTYLAAWMRQTAARQGLSSIRMPVPEGSPGDRLLSSLGWNNVATSWVLHLPPGVEIAERQLPDGYQMRTATSQDDKAVWTLLEDAFLEWADRERESFADFQAKTRLRPDFEPWNLRVVRDAEGAIVAAALVLISHPEDDEPIEAFVERLGVRRDQRGLGLAQALLADSFREARAHGAVRSSLSTDSRTGALSLYEKVGMTVSSVWISRGINVSTDSD
jgi:mycothiol synthase